jgi:putative methyltransferase (TIGR04325 family)
MSLIQKLRRRLFPPREVIEGYESEELIETIYRKTVAFRPEGDWPLVANLTAVLDIGGGAGIHYKLARQQSPAIRWAVVETPAMVRRASELATDQLMFFDDIEKAADWLGSIDLMHSNGAIQYVEEPIGTVKALCAARPAKMVWYRVPIGDTAKAEVQTSLLSNNGPGELAAGTDKLVKYARHWIPEEAFVAAHKGYQLSESGPDPRERGTQQFNFVPSTV